MIGVFLLSLVVAFSGAAVPGPLFALTLQQGLVLGWQAGLWLIVGHMLCEVVVVVAMRYGLGALLSRPAVLRTISLVGGLILLWMAWGMLVDIGIRGELHTAAGSGAPLPIAVLIAQGALLTLINPYWYVWWGTAGLALIAGQSAKHGSRAWPAFFTGHILGDYIWYIAVALLAGLGRNALSPAVHRSIIATCGLGIAVVGVLFLVRAARGGGELTGCKDRGSVVS
jgi:threonine/homoserine/homoserine lactone efflux protein